MSDNKLRVLQLILNLERAGAQEVVRILSEYLAMNDCVPVVCTFKNGPLRQDLEEIGIKVEVLGPRRYSILAFPWFIAEVMSIRRRLAQLIDKYQIDVVQTHLLEMLDFLTLSLRYGTNLQVVLWTIHNVNFLPTMEHRLLKLKRFVYRWLYRLAASKVSGFIAVSDEVQQALIDQVGPIQDKVTTIVNGVDVRRYESQADGCGFRQQLGLPSDSRLIVTVGRLTTQKGHCYLIDAATRVVRQEPNAHFLFVGDGELKETLQAQVQSLGLTEHIHFLGIRTDIPKILAVSELFVLPSLWEGLSIALLEGMAAAKPIIATAVSGTNQVLIHTETGLIVPPGESQPLAEAIIQCLANPTQAQAMGQAAKQHVQRHYSAQKQVDEHLALYRRLLAQPAPVRA